MTLGTFLARVLDELNEPSLTAQAMLAARSAIKHYDGDDYWFTEGRSLTVTTSSSQEWYGAADNALIPDLPGIESIILIQNAQTRIPLDRKSQHWFNEVSTNPQTTGQPEYFDLYGGSLRLYPIPDAAYQLVVTANAKGTLTASLSASSVWLDEAEELIRQRTKADLEINILKVPEQRQEALLLAGEGYLSLTEKIAHQRLVRESMLRGTSTIPQSW